MMKMGLNRGLSSRNELETIKTRLSGRNRLDFGTVRPRVQIPGPRPSLYSKSAIPEVVSGQRHTAGSHLFAEQ